MPRTRGAAIKAEDDSAKCGAVPAEDATAAATTKAEEETPPAPAKVATEEDAEEQEAVPPPASAPAPTPADAPAAVAKGEEVLAPTPADAAAAASADAATPTPTVTASPSKPPLSSKEAKKDRDYVKVIPAVPIPDPEPDPNVPSNRDVCVGFDAHIGTMLLQDLIRIHYFLWKKSGRELPKEEKDAEELAARLTSLVVKGKKYELSGLKDVPKPFFKGQGRFFEKGDGAEWKRLDDDGAKSYVTHFILAQFKALDEEKTTDAELQECVDLLFSSTRAETADEPHSAPRPCDVLFLPVEFPWEENMAYEHQVGNKHLLFLASQHVSGDSKESDNRVDAAFKLITSKIEVNSGTDLVLKTPRYVIQLIQDSQNSWQEMPREDLAEFAVVFVFEVYLEKQIHGIGGGGTAAASLSAAAAVSPKVASLLSDTAKATDTPIDTPTTHDVLFGRGGMTNGHPGNRRFRDVIALHRPDYIRATKMDKPNVARRIVRAIRQGNPPGRFLRKHDDGDWYDVGDKVAAEKTSQGLRERSNAEKRQRSALREALRIRKGDLAEGDDNDEEEGGGEPSAKKAKTAGSDGGTVSVAVGTEAAKDSSGETMNYAGVFPLSLNMKDKSKDGTKGGKKSKKSGIADGEEESKTESLPPNAVDENGNILVTDYDILCGRGGLTNHHTGNKRFRDIVALHRPDYVRAPKIQKPSVARVIVRAIRNGDPPGRFIRKNEETGLWEELSDKKAAEKTSQALREKTTEEKQGSIPPGFSSPTMILPTATGIADGSTTETKGADEKSDARVSEKGTEEEGKKNENEGNEMDVEEAGDQDVKEAVVATENSKVAMSVEI